MRRGTKTVLSARLGKWPKSSGVEVPSILAPKIATMHILELCISPKICMSEFPLDDPDGDSLPQSDRLQILSPEEYELLWGFPRFTQSDRDLFFTSR
jgi:hypothetical protein